MGNSGSSSGSGGITVDRVLVLSSKKETESGVPAAVTDRAAPESDDEVFAELTSMGVDTGGASALGEFIGRY